jgi:hypothetical protein
MRFVLSIVALVMMLGLAGPAFADGVKVKDAWARASIGTKRPGVVYMRIVNTGAESDRLLSAETPVAKRAAVHESLMWDGVMKMRPAGDIDIAPGGMVMLKPGSLHLMLTFLQKELVKGESFPLTLTFEHAGAVTVDVTVAGMGAKMAPNEHGHHDHEQHKEHMENMESEDHMDHMEEMGHNENHDSQGHHDD